jgi:hypothetical protein
MQLQLQLQQQLQLHATATAIATATGEAVAVVVVLPFSLISLILLKKIYKKGFNRITTHTKSEKLSTYGVSRPI